MLMTLLFGGVIPLVLSEPFPPLYPALDITLPAAVSADCRKDTQRLSEGLFNRSLWAMKMLDASEQSLTGVLYGSVWQLGNFDDCIEVQYPIKAQFCVPAIHAESSQDVDPNSVWNFVRASNEPSSMPRDTVHVGICVPSSCSPSEIEMALQAQLTLFNANNTVKYNVTLPEILCTKTKSGRDYSAGEIAFWFCSILIIIAAIAGSFLHHKKTEQLIVRVLKCFSVPGNFERLLEFREEERNHPLTVLHGIKVISIISVVYGHRSGIPLGLATSNYQEVEEYRRTPHNMFMPQADLVVDTFFFISGALTTYFMYHLMTKKPINPLQAIFTRIARIFPSYMFIVWIQASVVHRLGSGPLWYMVEDSESVPCQNYWWANALFINNYLSGDKMCLIHAWYLQCDVHFFILAVILLMILAKYPKTGFMLLTSLTLMAPVIPALLVYFYKLRPIVLFYDEFLRNPRASPEFQTIYIKSHARVSVYLIGIVVGYILYKYKDSKHVLSKWPSILTTLLGLALLFAPMAIGGMYYSNELPGPVFSAIYAAIRRPLWGAGLSFLLAVHRFGPPNMISRAFSCRALVVLSKLTFGVYLIHFVLISANLAKVRIARHFNFFDVMGEGSGDLLSSCIYAVMLYLLIELPFKRLFQEIIFAKTIQQFTDDVIQKQRIQDTQTVKL